MEPHPTGLILFAHGSRLDTANEQVRAVARELARQGGYEHVEPAFLELASPDLPAAVTRLSEQGVRRVVVIPYFLTLGTHMQRDLPALIEEAARQHPGVAVSSTPPLDGHPALLQILQERADEALALADDVP